MCDIATEEITLVTNNIDTFMRRLLSSWKHRQTRKVVYFHNLKFDGAFILSWLLNKGWVYGDGHKSFTCLITDLHVFYAVELRLYYRGFERKVCFYDSLKKLPFSEEAIAQAFEMDIKKGVIDYALIRRDWTVTAEEREYIETDVKIIAKALKSQIDNGLDKMTIAADALAEYKRFCGKNFRTWFPVISDVIDGFLREGYIGGYCYCDPKYADRRLKGIYTYDVHSLYPSQMRTQLLPHGLPRPFTGEYVFDAQYPLYVVKFDCRFELKEGYLPTVPNKTRSIFFRGDVYVSSSRGESVTLTMTCVDYKLFLEHYDVVVEHWYGGYKFRARKGMFDGYIDCYYHIKQTSEGAEKTRAKLLLNSLYGKFAKRRINYSVEPYLDESGALKYKPPIPDKGRLIYLPLAMFVTAYGRQTLFEGIDANRDSFVYCDTDCIHTFGEAKGISVTDNDIGTWGAEQRDAEAYYISTKCYMLREGGKYKRSIAGCPKDLQSKFVFPGEEDAGTYPFRVGVKVPGKLRYKVVPGGAVLEPTTFEIKERL